MAKETSEYKMEILFKEYDQVSQGVRALLLFGEKLFAFGIAIMTIGLSYGLKEKIDEILLYQPLIVSAVLLYAAHIYAELRAVAGYKRYLEERINREVREPILLWEGMIAKKRHRAVGQKLSYLIYLTLYVITIYISLRIAWYDYGLSTFIILLFINAILFIGAIVSIIEMYKAFYLSYETAQIIAEPTTKSGTQLLESLPAYDTLQIEKKDP